VPGTIVVGAHYDTWFAGSSDNGGGVAALVALAARRARAPAPRHTLVFVAYDGEEVALYGGYDYLRKHAAEMLAVMNFEVPAVTDASLLGAGRSNLPAFDAALDRAGLRALYPIYVYMNAVPALFGGIIPTDIQGAYRAGIPTVSTASVNPYYHTIRDTPEQVDTTFLAEVVDAFDEALGALDGLDAADLAGPDPALWRAAVTVAPTRAGLAVAVTVTDAAGSPRAAAPVTAALLADDFFPVGDDHAVTGVDGTAALVLPAAAGQPRRYVHVTAGPSYPLVETIVAVP
jgi:Zn-dependent M28 family amino/carboxypeptidase